MEHSQENEIIHRIQSGDTHAFGVLYDAYIKDIYRFIYYKTHQKEVAEDLTSEVFTKAFEKLSSFSTDKGSFRPWLYQIARNKVIDHYRTRKSSENIEDAWDIASNENQERDLEAKQMADQLQEFLHLLTSDQRDIIVMRLWQDMSYKEISEVLGKTETNCRVSYARGVEKLRTLMPLALLVLFFSFQP